MIAGLTEHERRLSLVALLNVIVALPRLDEETARRARWLKWRLEGFDPFKRIDEHLARFMTTEEEEECLSSN